MTSPAPQEQADPSPGPARRLAAMRGLTPIAETNAYADPQVVYSKLRAEWGEVAPVELEPGINGWLVMGYEENVAVLRQEWLFAKDANNWGDLREGRVKPDSPLLPLMAPRPNAFFLDGEEHRRLRAPLDEAVASLKTLTTRRQTVEVCDSLIAQFAERGQADLVSEYAMMIPPMAVGRMLGLDLDQVYELHSALRDLMATGEKAQTGIERFNEIVAGLVRSRQAEPADDMATVIAAHPNLTDDSERMQTVSLLLVCAAEITMAWIGTVLRLLLTDPRFAGRMRGGRLGIDEALDEVLWRESPVSSLPARYALRDTELGGQLIQPGDPLILAFGAAIADPRMHADDDEWIEAGNRAHLAWSGGPHICPAHVPARVLVHTAVETALHRLPGLRLTVSADEVGRLPSPWTRCPASLPVTFKPVTVTPSRA